MTVAFNRRDLDFLLYEVLDLQGLLARPRYAMHDRAVVDAVLDTAAQIATEKFQPCAAALDATEPVFEGGTVRMLPQAREALAAYAAAGFCAAAFDEEVGGLQLPALVTQAAGAMFYGANLSLAAYPMLTAGVANLLVAYGSAAHKAQFLPRLLDGRFFGTMCLSEPQAGSSLADIRTRAVPAAAGHYLISGTKMWISGGEHDLSENIVHLVLAKIPGGPPGVKGISLFIVPRRRPGPDGAVGDPNHVVLAGLNHKMGYRGIVNTVLNFGEGGECHGYLVGEPHRGIEYMFQMMNEARIAVGMGAAATGGAGYLYALGYARERRQGRSLRNRNPASPPVPIIEHPDVKRLLLAQKGAIEGAMALLLYCARLVDERKAAGDEERRREASQLLDVLTPIAKSWPSEFCLEANKHAIQVLGGYGYTRDYPVERLYRDNRLNAIHEGTHGIHGLDLLGRRVRMEEGAGFRALCRAMRSDAAAAQEVESLREYSDSLKAALDAMEETTRVLLGCPDAERGLANATLYLDTLGHIVVAWMWLKQALSATRGLAAATGEQQAFYRGKLAACRYFFRYELPATHVRMQFLRALDDTCARMAGEWF